MPRHALRSVRPLPGAERLPGGDYVRAWQGTAVMGILNVTPDSFSDGGRFLGPDEAVAQGRLLVREGAMIIDIGGESTRPGAEPVAAAAEADRVLPVIRRLAADSGALISIDSCKPEVAEAALEAGAHLVNDVRGLRDAEMIDVCRRAGAPAVVMHMRGEPRTMQQGPSYRDVVAEVHGFLAERAEAALAAGVPDVLLDPGIGFGKLLEHNLELLRSVSRLAERGKVLVGASRKGMIHALGGAAEPRGRDPGSLAAHLFAAWQGAAVVRCHAVAEHVQALGVWQRLHG